MTIYTSIEITMHCACCADTLCQPLNLKGNSVKRKKQYKASNWKEIVKDEIYVGPKCLALYAKMEDVMKHKGIAYVSDPIDHSDDKPSNEIIGDTHVWGYMSRYCEYGYKNVNSVTAHEMKFHGDEYRKPPYNSRKKVQIHTNMMAKKMGRSAPKCQTVT